MGSLGIPEIAFIFVLALLIFGPKKLPEMGRTLGRGFAEFRKATDELKRSINTELTLDEAPTPPVLRNRRFEEVEEPRAPQEIAAPPGEAPPQTEGRAVAFPPAPLPATAAEPVAVPADAARNEPETF
jgi:TatA/E family protein of Tat protein translocase